MRKKEAPISTRIPDTPLKIFNPPGNPRSRRNSALRSRENLRDTIEWGDSAEGKPTQAGGDIAGRSGGASSKTYGRYAFPMKASGGPNDPPNAIEGENLRPPRKK